MAEQIPVVRMRTRSQSHMELVEPGDGAAGGDLRAPGDNTSSTEQLGGRSSVNRDSPTDFQTQPETEILSAIPDISEPVLKASDRRIRTLIAKTTTGKMFLDTSIKELDTMAKRHAEYQKAAEPAVMLVDKAYKIKSKVREAEQIEKKLISDFGNLSLLLEMLNLDGEEAEKKRGVELGNKVTADMAKYKGLVGEFEHTNRATLTFAIPKRADVSQPSSAHSSRNSSLERRPQITRLHDHFKPNKVGWEDSLEVVLDMQDRYKIWMKEVTRVSGKDLEYEWNSLMSLLDKKWVERMNEDRTLRDKQQEEWLEKMNLILVDRFPILGRRLEHVGITKHNNELPSTFMERVFSTMYSSQIDKAPPVARALVYISGQRGWTRQSRNTW